MRTKPERLPPFVKIYTLLPKVDTLLEREHTLWGINITKESGSININKCKMGMNFYSNTPCMNE